MQRDILIYFNDYNLIIINILTGYKQAFIVRKDLAMGVGKIAAQVAHAAVIACEEVKRYNQSWFNGWMNTGQAKIVLKVTNQTELMEITKLAFSYHLPVSKIIDSGLTQIPHGTWTCIAIGPAPAELIDKITKGLKLL